MLNAAEIEKRWKKLTAEVKETGYESATIIAVTKTFPPSIFQVCVDLGIVHVGENRIQELKTKTEENQNILERLKIHFIGPLQSNKAKELDGRAASFDALQSLEVARKIERRWSAPKPLSVLFQINSTGEEQKSGILPQDEQTLDALMEYCLKSGRLKPEGLMTMGPTPSGDYNSQSREYRDDTKRAFQTTKALLEKLEKNYSVTLPRLSMGMSHDYRIALENGSTEIRVGSLIFGSRTTPIA